MVVSEFFDVIVILDDLSNGKNIILFDSFHHNKLIQNRLAMANVYHSII